MNKETFWLVVAGWSVAVVVMCAWLYRTARHNDKEEDHQEAICDDILFDLKKRYGPRLPVPPILDQAERWKQNARVSEGADDTWDSGDAA